MRKFASLPMRQKLLAWSAAGALALFAIPFLFSGTPLFSNLFGGFVVAAILVAVGPSLAYVYAQQYRTEAMETQFPTFLRDLAEAKKSGMTLPLALERLMTSDYGALSKEIELMANQVSWGVPFEEVLTRFSNRVNSVFVSRAVTIINEANRSGGEIADILASVAHDAKMIKESEAARAASMSQYVVTVYVIFYIFLGILVSMNEIMGPISKIPQAASIGIDVGSGASILTFKILFFHMALVHGLMTGLLAGEIGGGSIVGGLKHSAVFLLSALLVFLVVVYDYRLECIFAFSAPMLESLGCG